MLAQSLTAPFDSDEHLFEIKWDGVRCIAFVEDGRLRLQNRRYFELRERYPELACLTGLPAGTVIDGEIVALVDGKPSFNRLMQRDHVGDARRAIELAGRIPVTFMAFDLLFDGGRGVMRLPLVERRGRLEALVSRLACSTVLVPSYVVGAGKAYFAAAEQAGLEGIMAKRLASVYQPGARSPDWVKIKVAQMGVFDIIGFTKRDGQDAISALAIGMPKGRQWVFKGKVGSGFTERQRAELYRRLAPLPELGNAPKRDAPRDVQWRETGLSCRVRYFEKLATGMLRAPIFHGLIEAPAPRE